MILYMCCYCFTRGKHYSAMRAYIIIYLRNEETTRNRPTASRSFCQSVSLFIFSVFILFLNPFCFFFALYEKPREMSNFLRIHSPASLPNIIVGYSLLLLRSTCIPIAFSPLVLMKWFSSNRCARRIEHWLDVSWFRPLPISGIVQSNVKSCCLPHHCKPL